MGAFKFDEKMKKQAVLDYLDGAIAGTNVKKMPGAMFSVGRTAWVGCMVAVNGKRINTMPMTHGLGMTLLFILLALSVLPLVIYGVVVVPKQKKLVAEVDAKLEALQASPELAGVPAQ